MCVKTVDDLAGNILSFACPDLGLREDGAAPELVGIHDPRRALLLLQAVGAQIESQSS